MFAYIFCGNHDYSVICIYTYVYNIINSYTCIYIMNFMLHFKNPTVQQFKQKSFGIDDLLSYGEFIKWVCPQNSQVMDDKYWYLQMGLPSGFFPSPYLVRDSATWSPRHLQLCLVSAPERSRRSGSQSIGCCFFFQCSTGWWFQSL